MKYNLLELQREISQLPTDVKANYHFPNVAVVGPQSSGKSSLLNSIAKFQFFPTGAGTTVTRCPVQLQLKNDGLQQYIEIDRVRVEKDRVMNILYQKNREIKGFSDRRIDIKYNNPKGINLILLDLPGLITFQGQRVGSKKEIQDLISRQLKNPNIIVLCINKGTDDINNSLSLQFLKQQQGFQRKRIIPIMTHLDKIQTPISILNQRFRSQVNYIGCDVFYVASGQTEDQQKELERIGIAKLKKISRSSQDLELTEGCTLERLVAYVTKIGSEQFKRYIDDNHFSINKTMRLQIDRLKLQKARISVKTPSDISILIEIFVQQFRRQIEGRYTRDVTRRIVGCQIRTLLKQKINQQIQKAKQENNKELTQKSLQVFLGLFKNIPTDQFINAQVSQVLKSFSHVVEEYVYRVATCLRHALDIVLQDAKYPDLLTELYRSSIQKLIDQQQNECRAHIGRQLQMRMQLPDYYALKPHLFNGQSQSLNTIMALISQASSKITQKFIDNSIDIIKYELPYKTCQRSLRVVLQSVGKDQKNIYQQLVERNNIIDQRIEVQERIIERLRIITDRL